MNILLLSTSHPEKTAGVIAKDFLNSINSVDGLRAKLIVQPWDNYLDKDIISIDGKVASRLRDFCYKVRNRLNKYLRLNRNVDINYSAHVFDETITYYKSKKFLRKLDFVPEVIIVMFMPTFLSFKNLYEFYKLTGAKILLYPMDNAPYTGGCHWNWACTGFMEQCGKCPALKSQSEYDQSKRNMLYKAKYIGKTEIELLAPNLMIQKKLEKSSLFQGRKIHYILPSIDENFFKPSNKEDAKITMGLPTGKKVIFFGAVSLADGGTRKGFRELNLALHLLVEKLSPNEQDNLHLVQTGGKSLIDLSNFPFSSSNFGFLDLNKLSVMYQAADVFICPSIEDAGPLMIVQSIMSGTPVVAFEMGVAVDLIINNKTGYLAKLKDFEDLARGIIKVFRLSKDEYEDYSRNCREYALEKCSKAIFGESIKKILTSFQNKTRR